MTLQVDEVGSGPPVLLLHGIPHPVSDFAPVVERLRGTHRVLAAYLPGFGASPRLVPYSFAAVRDALVGEMLARDANRLAIVGFSQGGLHALALAMDRRLEVQRVIVLAGLVRYHDAQREQMSGFSALLREGPDLRDASWRAIAAQLFTARPELADAVGDWLTSTASGVLADNIDAMLAEDLRPRLHEIRAPVFLRTGSRDVVAPPAVAEEIAASCQQATVEIAEGIAHAMCLEDPAGTAQFVARALR